MKKRLLLSCSALLSIAGVWAQTGNFGIGTPTPGTKLDVNGAITNRETTIAVASNAAAIAANTSMVRLTGTATALITMTATAAPNAGQRLIVFNNTTGGFDAVLNGFTVTNGQAVEYIFSNGAYQATNNGISAAQFWKLTGNAGTTPPTATGTAVGVANFWGTTDAQNLAVGTNSTTRAIFDQNGSLYGGNLTYNTTLNPANSLVWGNTNADSATATFMAGQNNIIGSGATSSAVVGNGNKALGLNSLVAGIGNTDSSQNSFVFGNNNILGSGLNALGGNNRTNRGTILGGGTNSVTGGENYNSMINGSQNTILGNCFESIVGGFVNKITGSQKVFVQGQNNVLTGSTISAAIGKDNTMTNAGNSFILGLGNSISSENSAIIGNFSSIPASQSNSMVLGTNGATTTSNQLITNFQNGQYFHTSQTNLQLTASDVPTVSMVPFTGATLSNRVGFNVTAPTQPLDIVTQNPSADNIHLTSYGSGPTPALRLRAAEGNAATPAFLPLAAGPGAAFGAWINSAWGGTGFADLTSIRSYTTQQHTASALGANMVFFTTANNTTATTERMRIENNGYVGIGTSIPTSPLQVVGLPTYATDALAGTGGLTAGAFYKHSDGSVYVKN